MTTSRRQSEEHLGTSSKATFVTQDMGKQPTTMGFEADLLMPQKNANKNPMAFLEDL